MNRDDMLVLNTMLQEVKDNKTFTDTEKRLIDKVEIIKKQIDLQIQNEELQEKLKEFDN